MNKKVTAAFIIIGNEILSGRTKDQNLNFLATSLNEMGIGLIEVRVVRDIEQEIINAVNELRTKYNYVFTSGGIGPTHDDITAMAIAKAFNTELICDRKARKLLEEHYGSKLNEARLKMAYIPKNSTLLNNPVSSAPGFKTGNVFVMAGVPKIMQSMFLASKEHLETGQKTHSSSISAFIAEGDIALELNKVQNQYDSVEIGSYPFIKDGKLGTSLVFRSTDKSQVRESLKQIKSYLEKIQTTIEKEV